MGCIINFSIIQVWLVNLKVRVGPPIISEEARSKSEHILEKKWPYAWFSPNIMGQISGEGLMRCTNIMWPMQGCLILVRTYGVAGTVLITNYIHWGRREVSLNPGGWHFILNLSYYICLFYSLYTLSTDSESYEHHGLSLEFPNGTSTKCCATYSLLSSDRFLRSLDSWTLTLDDKHHQILNEQTSRYNDGSQSYCSSSQERSRWNSWWDGWRVI